MPVKITVDATQAIAKFSPSGIPEAVRRNLRKVLPGLTRKLGGLVEEKLNTQLKTRRRLEVKKELVENPREVTGRVRVNWTGEKEKSFIPQVLESGARAHPIVAKNAGALYFYWAKVGHNVMFQRVWHPGFAGIHYMQNSFREMEDEIFDTVDQAVKAGANSTNV